MRTSDGPGCRAARNRRGEAAASCGSARPACSARSRVVGAARPRGGSGARGRDARPRGMVAVDPSDRVITTKRQNPALNGVRHRSLSRAAPSPDRLRRRTNVSILNGAEERQSEPSCSEGCGPEQAVATRSGRLSTSAAFGARLSFGLGAVLARGGSDGGGRPEWVAGEPLAQRAARGAAPVPGEGAASRRSRDAGEGRALPFPGRSPGTSGAVA